MAAIFDLFEVTSISENTTYSTTAGNLLGIVDNVSSADLNDGEFDEGDTIFIDGVSYRIDIIQEPFSSGRFILGDGSDRSFNPASESNLDVVFLTVSNGSEIRHFIIPNDRYGNMNVQSIRTGSINDVAGSDAALVSTSNNDVNVVCFAAGTMIRGAEGDFAIEEIRVGAFIQTLDKGPQKVRMILKRELDFRTAPNHLKPIKLEAETLGVGRPSRPLMVSPQHRLLVKDTFGNSVLVPAKSLIRRRGIRVAHGVRKITYFHLVFSGHEVIFANDTPTESFFPGAMALKAIPKACRSEVLEIFGFENATRPDDITKAAAPVLRFQEAKRQAFTFH